MRRIPARLIISSRYRGRIPSRFEECVELRHTGHRSRKFSLWMSGGSRQEARTTLGLGTSKPSVPFLVVARGCWRRQCSGPLQALGRPKRESRREAPPEDVLSAREDRKIPESDPRAAHAPDGQCRSRRGVEVFRGCAAAETRRPETHGKESQPQTRRWIEPALGVLSRHRAVGGVAGFQETRCDLHDEQHHEQRRVKPTSR